MIKNQDTKILLVEKNKTTAACPHCFKVLNKYHMPLWDEEHESCGMHFSDEFKKYIRVDIGPYCPHCHQKIKIYVCGIDEGKK